MEPLSMIAPGIHLWRAAHPDWNTSCELVACYALELERDVIVVDPLLPEDGADTLERLTELVGSRRAHVHVTIPYHVRDSERVATALDAPIHGHAALARRLTDDSRFRDATRGGLPDGCRTVRIGSPRRQELPLVVEPLRALVFGDAIVGVRGGVRIWEDRADRPWYRERFVPSLEFLADLDVDHVLVTHGEPVVGDGRAALRSMLDAAPVAKLLPALTGAAVP